MVHRTHVIGGLVVLALVLSRVAMGNAFHIAPTVQDIRSDGATFIWETTEPTRGEVQCVAPDGTARTAAETTEGTIHRVRIDGLLPGTRYTYRVPDGTSTFERSFATAPGTARPITFVVFGDTRRWGEDFEASPLASHVMQWKPEFFINTGDIVHDGRDYDLWPEHFTRFAALLPEYMMVTARANHEHARRRNAKRDWFAQYQELPGAGEPYASFDWGNTHFVLISYDAFDCAAPWLDAHLDNVQAAHVVVVAHYPIYCTGYREVDDRRQENGSHHTDLQRVFEKHHVDLHICGHTHIFERSYPLRNGARNDSEGTTYVVQGGDIGGNYRAPWTAAGDDRAMMTNPTYTLIQCRDDRIELRSFCVAREGDTPMPMDHVVLWRDPTVPQRVLDGLPTAQGSQLTAAIETLGAMQYQPAAPALLTYLDPEAGAVREVAAVALGRIGAPDVAAALASYLDDPDLVVRRAVARSLEVAMPGALVERALTEVRNADQDLTVRVALLGGVENAVPPRPISSELIALVKDETLPAELRRRAADALRKVAGAGHASTLRTLVVLERDPYVRVQLRATLRRLS